MWPSGGSKLVALYCQLIYPLLVGIHIVLEGFVLGEELPGSSFIGSTIIRYESWSLLHNPWLDFSCIEQVLLFFHSPVDDLTTALHQIGQVPPCLRELKYSNIIDWLKVGEDTTKGNIISDRYVKKNNLHMLSRYYTLLPLLSVGTKPKRVVIERLERKGIESHLVALFFNISCSPVSASDQFVSLAKSFIDVCPVLLNLSL